jgi:hypothetical protein
MLQNLLRRLTADELNTFIDTLPGRLSADERAELLHRVRSIPESVADDHERRLLRSLQIWDVLMGLTNDF